MRTSRPSHWAVNNSHRSFCAALHANRAAEHAIRARRDEGIVGEARRLSSRFRLFLRPSHHSAPPHAEKRQHVYRHHRGTTRTKRLTMSMTPIGCCRPRLHSCHTSAHLHMHLQEEGSPRTREDNVTHKHPATHRTHTILNTSDRCLGGKPSPWSACRQCTLPMHMVQRSDARATCTKQVEDLFDTAGVFQHKSAVRLRITLTKKASK